MTTNNASPSKEKMPVPGFFLRLFWMIVGSSTLAVSGLYIAQQEDRLLTWADVVYWALIPLMIAARYYDIAKFHGTTSYGEPATKSHWRRYSLGLLIGATAAWALLHAYVFIT